MLQVSPGAARAPGPGALAQGQASPSTTIHSYCVPAIVARGDAGAAAAPRRRSHGCVCACTPGVSASTPTPAPITAAIARSRARTVAAAIRHEVGARPRREVAAHWDVGERVAAHRAGLRSASAEDSSRDRSLQRRRALSPPEFCLLQLWRRPLCRFVPRFTQRICHMPIDSARSAGVTTAQLERHQEPAHAERPERQRPPAPPAPAARKARQGKDRSSALPSKKQEAISRAARAVAHAAVGQRHNCLPACTACRR